MGRMTFDGNFCDIAMCHEDPCHYDGSCTQKRVWERLKAYEDTGLEPEEITAHADNWCAFYCNRRCNLDGDWCPEGPGCPMEISPDKAPRLRELAKAEKDGRLVVLPCKVGSAVDKLFFHNEVIALWYDKPNDKDHSYLLWRGEAWRIPDEYKDQRILKF
ncbi:MAG: hypothetical protein Q4P84_08025, partial [Elusimicrobiales bacterium]|nr:hypothetical protein [Elusimicrobiales bacterium]